MNLADIFLLDVGQVLVHLNQPVHVGQKDRTLVFFPVGADQLGGVVNLQADTDGFATV